MLWGGGPGWVQRGQVCVGEGGASLRTSRSDLVPRSPALLARRGLTRSGVIEEKTVAYTYLRGEAGAAAQLGPACVMKSAIPPNRTALQPALPAQPPTHSGEVPISP